MNKEDMGAAERAAIVAFLRRRTDAPICDAVRRLAADTIERGEHLNTPQKRDASPQGYEG